MNDARREHENRYSETTSRPRISEVSEVSLPRPYTSFHSRREKSFYTHNMPIVKKKMKLGFFTLKKL